MIRKFSCRWALASSASRPSPVSWCSTRLSTPTLLSVCRPRIIKIYGTGHQYDRVSNEQRFIGTVVMSPFVWHVFELIL
jgi:hypothetical protein